MDIRQVIFNVDKKFSLRDVEKFRGFFGEKFKENIDFHNHKDKFNFNYAPFPSVQYRLFENEKLGVLLMPNLENKNYFVSSILDIDEINISNILYKVNKIEYKKIDCDFKVGEELFRYKFVTPWIALNDKNHAQYMDGTLDLNRVLQNNLLSNFKGLGITVDKKIMVNGVFTPQKQFLKDTEFIVFYGEFVSNVYIPNGFAVGKRKSIGYGVIEKID